MHYYKWLKSITITSLYKRGIDIYGKIEMLFKREQISCFKVFDIWYQVLPRSVFNSLLWIPIRDDSKLEAGEIWGKFYFHLHAFL